METFDNIPEALHYATLSLAARGHAYVVNIRGPREVRRPGSSTVVVEPSSDIYDDGNLGLAVHFPYDPSSGWVKELAQFLDTEGHGVLHDYAIGDIPVHVMEFGQDVPRATKVLEYMLERVYGYPAGTAIRCEVYDRGPAVGGGRSG